MYDKYLEKPEECPFWCWHDRDPKEVEKLHKMNDEDF